MSDEHPEIWPLRPSHSASVVHGLCLVLADLARAEGPDYSRRAYLELAAVATAAELFSHEVAHWFYSRKGEEEDVLDSLEARYECESQRTSSRA